MSPYDLALVAAAIPPVGASLYLSALALASIRQQPLPPALPQLRFDIVIPAHDEERGIEATIASVLAVDYPRARYRVLVVADNCRDQTAAVARRAGAEVLVRNEPDLRGKGYALKFGFRQSLEDRFADVIVVVDADTTVSPSLLQSFADAFAAGADAVQADYGVRNARTSPRTRLMHIALTAFHALRSLARERLGLSCGLRGNGMAFAVETLRRVPYSAYSLVEDIEYGIALGQAGIRVSFAAEARVLGDMPDTADAATTQRQRWEGGRSALIRRIGIPLLLDSWRRRSFILLDMAADLFMPPLARLVTILAAGTVLSWSATLVTDSVRVAPWIWAAGLLGITAHVARACVLSNTGLRALTDLGWAPVYMLWKLTLRFKETPNHSQEWIRTGR